MAMAAPMTISRHGLLGSDSLPPDQIEEFGPRIQAVRDEAEQALDQLEARIAGTDQDKSLSVLGKAERQKQLGKEAIKAIQEIAKKRRSLEADLDKAKRELPAGLPERKRLNEHQASAEEIRSHFQRLPILERRALLMTAAELDDVLTLLAIRNAPPSFEIVPQTVIDKAIQKWTEIHHAEAFERVQTIENVISIFDSNVNSASRIASQRSGFVPAE